MCQTSASKDLPLNTAPNGATLSANSGQGDFSSPGNDPLSIALQKEAAANPPTVSVNSPTKFGQLLKIITPALEGATIGGFSGKGHSGGGFGAAQEFYDKKRDRDLRMAQLQRQNAQTQSQIDERSRANDINQAKLEREDWGQPIAAQDKEGNSVFVVRNRRTGEVRQVNDVTPPDKSGPANTHMTDQGLMNVGRDGTASPVTIPGPSTPPSMARVRTGPNSVDPANFFSGASASPSAIRAIPGKQGPAVPLHAPGYAKPKVSKVANRDAGGAETDNLIDENPDSPTFGQTLKRNVGQRAPVPDRVADHRTAVADLDARAESYAGAAMQAAGNDPDKALQNLNGLKITDPKAAKDFASLLPRIRARIRDRARPGRTKSRSQLSAEDAAALYGSPNDDNQ